MWTFTLLNRPSVYGAAVFNRVNPIRAGIVDKPEDYRWSTLGYLVQRGNKEGLIDLNLGMHEWNEFNPAEIIRKYREFVYETGAAGRSQKSEVRGIRGEST